MSAKPGVHQSLLQSRGETNHVFLLGGRSGVGKPSVGAGASELLQAAGVAHCLIEGDNLDAAYPKAADDPHGTAPTKANLRALWQNCAAIGHTHAIYVNTVSVLEAPMVPRAFGGGRGTGVLLTGADEVLARRLGDREIGSVLQRQLQRSAAMATHLQEAAGPDVVRVSTDDRVVTAIATEVLQLCGWLPTSD